MTDGNSKWTWSPTHQDHYYVTYDEYSRPLYHWYKQGVQPNPQEGHRRIDSGAESSNVPQMPEPAGVPNEVSAMKAFIAGTPETGWYDGIDRSYVMRAGVDAYRFFEVGKVFAMLYIENAAETASHSSRDAAYTEVRFGGVAYSTIRRFIVVEVRRGFVNACGIGTYSGRGS